jgi:hypothetical protein
MNSPPRKKPDIHSNGGLAGSRAGLNVFGDEKKHRKGVDLRPVQPVAYKIHRRRYPGTPYYELEELKYAEAFGSVCSDSEYNLTV